MTDPESTNKLLRRNCGKALGAFTPRVDAGHEAGIAPSGSGRRGIGSCAAPAIAAKLPGRIESRHPLPREKPVIPFPCIETEVRPQVMAFDIAASVDVALRLCAAELSSVIIGRRIRPLIVLGAPGPITLVLVHLLRNAAAATRATGRPGVIHLDTGRDGDRVRVRVSDNGAGSAAVSETPSCHAACGERAIRHHGLDLAVSVAIVRAHGGTMRRHERTPHGTRFSFDLPAADAPDLSPGDAACAAPPRLASLAPAPDSRAS